MLEQKHSKICWRLFPHLFPQPSFSSSSPGIRGCISESIQYLEANFSFFMFSPTFPDFFFSFRRRNPPPPYPPGTCLLIARGHAHRAPLLPLTYLSILFKTTSTHFCRCCSFSIYYCVIVGVKGYERFRSQSYQTFIFPVFRFSLLSLRVCSI